jgi:hypothetical protein
MTKGTGEFAVRGFANGSDVLTDRAAEDKTFDRKGREGIAKHAKMER